MQAKHAHCQGAVSTRAPFDQKLSDALDRNQIALEAATRPLPRAWHKARKRWLERNVPALVEQPSKRGER